MNKSQAFFLCLLGLAMSLIGLLSKINITFPDAFFIVFVVGFSVGIGLTFE